MDFTIKIYKKLLLVLKQFDYKFITFEDYCQGDKQQKAIILRHDVEKHYPQALKLARIQHELNIKGTYFFRILPKHFDTKVINEIASLGHEIAYHYDDLTECKGDYHQAILRFERHLELLRDIAPVQTICMDGSPRSPYDNKDLWKEKSYREYGLIGEPYFDMDFDAFFYLTDTGRRWDGWRVSMRDKVPQQAQWNAKGWVYHNTLDIIKAAQDGSLPPRIMFTFHPQRWHEKSWPWFKELVLQNIKNMVKYFLIK